MKRTNGNFARDIGRAQITECLACQNNELGLDPVCYAVHLEPVKISIWHAFLETCTDVKVEGRLEGRG